MKEHYVSYEQSQALKRLGFDKKVSAVWHFDGEEWNLIPDYGATFQHPKDIPHWNTSKAWGEFIYSASRLDQAQAWLREVKGIDIEISAYQHLDGESIKHQYSFVVLTINGKTFANTWYNNYEQALSDAVDLALELLGKEENNGM